MKGEGEREAVSSYPKNFFSPPSGMIIIKGPLADGEGASIMGEREEQKGEGDNGKAVIVHNT